jgi:NitT/TauT family transport system substrate-binding protein
VVEAKSDSGIVFMPGEHDFAARQGLKFEFVQFKGDALAIKAFLAGELDSYEGNPGAAILAAGHGADVRLVGCYWPRLTYGIFAKSSVADIKDLAGQTFAISGPGSLPDLVTRAILEAHGMAPNAVRFAVLGSDADRFRALSQGLVQAAAFSTEFLPLAPAQGMRLLANAAEEVPNYIRFCSYVSGRSLHERRAQAAGFLAASMQGWAYALAHPDEAASLSRRLTGAKPDDPRAAALFEQVARYHAVDASAPVPMAQLEWMQALLVRTRNLSAPYDLSRLVDTSLRTEAAARAGGG